MTPPQPSCRRAWSRSRWPRPPPAPTNRWPQFRGPVGRRRRERSGACPKAGAPPSNIVWKRRRAGHGLELARRVGRPRVRHVGRSTPARPKRRSPGCTSAANGPRLTVAASLDGHDVDFATGKVRWSKEVRNARAGRAEAPQEQLRVGDAGHRRRARLLLLRQRRPVRVRHEGQAGLVEAARTVQDALRVGHRRLARPPPRSPLHRQRQRRAVVPGGLRQADRRRGLAREPRRGQQLGDAVRLGARRPRTRSSLGHRQGALVRSDGKLLWELKGMSSISIPTPFERHGLLFISSGYVGDAAAAGVRDPPGRDRATSR